MFARTDPPELAKPSKRHIDMAYRADIDGLRAIAVLAVIGYHASPLWITSGFVGVDIFFVISGYLITTIIITGLERESFSYYEFYARRIRRIFPALIIVLAAVLIAGWILLRSDDYAQLGKHIAAGAAFVANFAYWQEAGYFDREALSKPLLHLWSLAVEEQFYIFWPLLLSVIWTRSKRATIAITLVIILISFSFNVQTLKTDPAASFYLPFGRLWELLLGACLTFLNISKWINQRQLNWISAAGFALVVISVFAFGSMSPYPELRAIVYPGLRAIVPTCGATLLIMAGTNAWINRTIISHRVLVWIGLISYPLYLWHWPLLAFAHALAEYGHEAGLERNIRIAAVALSFALAWLTYRFLEWPIRFQFRISPMLLAGGLAATLASGLLIQVDEGIPSRYINANPKSQFLQYYERLRKAGLSREECNFVDWQTKSHKTLSKDCTARGPAETWFLWGDSHAQALSLGLRSILPASTGLAQVATSGCYASLVHIDKPSYGNACNMSNDFARAEIARLRPSLLILAQKRHHELTDWDSIASFAHSNGVRRVILIGPVPQWEPSLPNIIAEYYWEKHPVLASIGLDSSVMTTNAKLSNRYEGDPNLTYISLIDRLCTPEGCLARIPGEWPRDLITFDYGHLTPDASVYIARDVVNAYISPSHTSYSARQ